MSIPLVQEATKDAINTSIIAIKRNIERINMLLGLSNSEEIDTSEFVKKSDIVDEVAIDNMHSVSSNAVAKANSYSTSETFTGRYWIDGKPIYRKVINVNGYPSTIQTGLTSENEVINMIIKNTVSGSSDRFVFGGILSVSNVYYPWVYELTPDNTTLARLTGTYTGTVKFIILEYTKKTD